MENKNRFYLFRMGKLVGPFGAQKIEAMRQSKEIFRYMWIMGEQDQRWLAIDDMPSENPFQVTVATLKERTISGALMNRSHPISGIIKGIHSFGVELLIGGQKFVSLLEQPFHVMNLIDETNLKSSNAEVIFQGQEKTSDGIVLRFAWKEAPVAL